MLDLHSRYDWDHAQEYPSKSMGVVRLNKERRNRSLRMRVQCHMPDGKRRTLVALVDSGAEINIIRSDLVGEEFFRQSPEPLNLVSADGRLIPGGKKLVHLGLQFNAVDASGRRHSPITVPTKLYEADIREDLLLGFDWLEKHFMMISAPERCLIYYEDVFLWLRGIDWRNPHDPLGKVEEFHRRLREGGDEEERYSSSVDSVEVKERSGGMCAIQYLQGLQVTLGEMDEEGAVGVVKQLVELGVAEFVEDMRCIRSVVKADTVTPPI